MCGRLSPCSSMQTKLKTLFYESTELIGFPDTLGTVGFALKFAADGPYPNRNLGTIRNSSKSAGNDESAPWALAVPSTRVASRLPPSRHLPHQRPLSQSRPLSITTPTTEFSLGCRQLTGLQLSTNPNSKLQHLQPTWRTPPLPRRYPKSVHSKKRSNLPSHPPSPQSVLKHPRPFQKSRFRHRLLLETKHRIRQDPPTPSLVMTSRFPRRTPPP